MVLPMEMGWRHLLFENWPVDPAVMDAHLPEALSPDTHGGSAWLTFVPFTNVAVRPAGLPERVGIRLPELNVRTYVTHDGVPSVYFFSLDAQGVTSVLVGRVLHHLPYFYARADLEVTGDRVRFESRRRHPGARPAHYRASYGPDGDPFAAPDDPLGSFLVERYRFYTEAQDGSVRFADVEHEPWTLAPATATVETNTLFAASGFARPEAEPVYHYSRGVDVRVSPSRRA